jgi:phage tail tape-measure protein
MYPPITASKAVGQEVGSLGGGWLVHGGKLRYEWDSYLKKKKKKPERGHRVRTQQNNVVYKAEAGLNQTSGLPAY